MPKVSIITPLYNGTKTFDETAESILNQDYSDWEWILFDDGSSDETASLAEEALANFPAGYLVRAPHGGKAAAVRAGMLSSTMEQIAFCDADDLVHEGWLAALVTGQRAAAEAVVEQLFWSVWRGEIAPGDCVRHHLMLGARQLARGRVAFPLGG